MKLETRSYSPLARMFGAEEPLDRVKLPNGHADYFAVRQLGIERVSLIDRWARWNAAMYAFVVARLRSGEGFGPGGRFPLLPRIAGGMGVQEGIGTRTQVILFQVSITPASVATIVCVEQNLTVTGLVVGDVLAYLSNTAAMATAVSATVGHVSAANTIAQAYCNPTAGALVPTAGTHNVVILRG